MQEQQYTITPLSADTWDTKDQALADEIAQSIIDSGFLTHDLSQAHSMLTFSDAPTFRSFVLNYGNRDFNIELSVSLTKNNGRSKQLVITAS
jgi:hypothetical protein